MKDVKIEGMEAKLEAANTAVEKILANKPDQYFTAMGVARLVAARHFTGKPEELADWEKTHRHWVEEDDCEGEAPEYPAGYTLTMETEERAAETGYWDLVDERGFLYLYDTGYPGSKDEYTGPVPKEFAEKWGL